MRVIGLPMALPARYVRRTSVSGILGLYMSRSFLRRLPAEAKLSKEAVSVVRRLNSGVRCTEQVLDFVEPDDVAALPGGMQGVFASFPQRIELRLQVLDVAVDGVEEVGLLVPQSAQHSLNALGRGRDAEDVTADLGRADVQLAAID